MPEKLWLARDSRYGVDHTFRSNHPRKWLLDYYGRKHASKIYRQNPSGLSVHVGWYIAGYWFDLFELTPMERTMK